MCSKEEHHQQKLRELRSYGLELLSDKRVLLSAAPKLIEIFEHASSNFKDFLSGDILKAVSDNLKIIDKKLKINTNEDITLSLNNIATACKILDGNHNIPDQRAKNNKRTLLKARVVLKQKAKPFMHTCSPK